MPPSEKPYLNRPGITDSLACACFCPAFVREDRAVLFSYLSLCLRALMSRQTRECISRLEITFKITKLNHQQTTPLCATSAHLLNHPQDGSTTTSLSSLFQCLATCSSKRFFLMSHLNLPRAA